MSDAGRKYDLEELYRERQLARNGYMRDTIDKKMDQILRESGAVRQIREQLIRAVRGDDMRAIKRLNQELWRINADKTYGREY